MSKIVPVKNNFLPTSITGCQWWLDGADPLGTGTKPTLNSALATWYDKSGNVRNATASSSATFTAGGILFTAGNYYTMSVPYSSNYSIFLVATNTTAQQCYFFGRNALGGTREPTFIQGYIGNGIGLEWYNSSDRATIATTPSSPFLASVHHTQGANVTGYYFGTQAFSISQTRSYYSTPWDTLGQSGGSANYYAGTMKELIFFSNVLTTSQRQSVEGYLLKKWGMIPVQKIVNLPPTTNGVRSFLPTSIHDCSLWLDAADSSTLTFSNQAITKWSDKSLMSNNYYVANQNTNITYSNNSLYFPGSNWLVASTIQGFAYGNNPFTSFIVFNSKGYYSVSQGVAGLFTYGQVGCSQTGYVNYIQSNSYYYTTLFCLAAGLSNTISSNQLYFTSDSFSNNGSGTVTHNAWLNASSVTSGTATTTSMNLQSNNGASAIGYNNNNDEVFTGNICEVIYYNNYLSTTLRQTIESYLAQKWGLSSKLPSGHPGLSIQVYGPVKAPLLYQSFTVVSTTTFNYTGSDQTYSVPSNVNILFVYLWGAGGQGSVKSATGAYGGAGAMVQGMITVTPSSTLTIIVGEGASHAGSRTYGGGGRSYQGDQQWYGSSGGGRSAIQLSAGTDYVVAGGGGGQGYFQHGGSATFSGTSQDGASESVYTSYAGGGGSQTAGGKAGTGGSTSGQVGSLQNGGNGSVSSYTGGGGGGYYGGGGAGGGGAGGGGGGSSFIDNLRIIPGQTEFGFNSPNTRSAPNTTSPFYSSPIGTAGAPAGNTGGDTGAAGGNGRVVIQAVLPVAFQAMKITSKPKPKPIQPLVFLTGYNYTSGNTWNDLSTFGRNATLARGSATNNGAANAVYIGSGTYWTFPNVGVSSSWTCIIWCKLSFIGTGCIITQRFSNGTSFNVICGNAANNDGFSFYNNGWRAGTNITLTSSTYTCFTGVYDGTSLKTYIRGSLVGSVSVSGAVDAGTVYRIGARWDTNGTIVGYIGEIRIYKEAFTADQVLADYTTASSLRPYI
jgi:hypothetical protein